MRGPVWSIEEGKKKEIVILMLSIRHFVAIIAYTFWVNVI